MKKLTAILWLFALPAFAGNYASTTYNNLTVNGTATVVTQPALTSNTSAASTAYTDNAVTASYSATKTLTNKTISGGTLSGTNASAATVLQSGATTSETLATEVAHTFSIDRFGAKLNAQAAWPTLTISGTSLTVATSNLLSNANLFSSGSVGQTIILPGLGTPGTQGGAFITTIAGYTSPTQVTLTAAPVTQPNGVVSYILWGNDDTAAINAANSAAESAHGGRIIIPGGKQTIAAGEITIGGNGSQIVLTSDNLLSLGGVLTDAQDSITHASGVIYATPQSNGNPGIDLMTNTAMQGITVMNSTVCWATSQGVSLNWRQIENCVLGYNGRGVQLGTNSGYGNDTQVNNNFIAGFNQGIYSNKNSRTYWDRNFTDNWNDITVNDDADVSLFSRNVAKPNAYYALLNVWNVASVANVGGLIQITLSGQTPSASNSFQSGDPINIVGVTGTNMTSVNGRWIAYLPNSGNPEVIDLYVYNPSYLGMNFSTGTATASTFPSGGVYSGSGGYAGISNANRFGTAFTLSADSIGADGNAFDFDFSLGHDLALNVYGGNWLKFNNFSAEGPPTLSTNLGIDLYDTGIYAGNTSSLTFNGGYLTVLGTLAIIDTQGSQFAPIPNISQVPARFTDFTFASNINSVALVHLSGSADFVDSSLQNGPIILNDVSSSVGNPRLRFFGGNLIGSAFFTQSSGDINHVVISGGTRMYASGISNISSLPYWYPGTYGMAYLAAPWNDQEGTYLLSSPTTGNTLTMPTGTRNLQLTPSGSLSTLTVSLPQTPNAADPFCIASTQAVSALTLTGGTTVGGPTSLSANASRCLLFDGTNWDGQ